jgi:hypothetical protein
MRKSYIAGFVIMAGLSIVLSAACFAQTQPPVGYWPFEESEGLAIKDASGRGHDGAIINECRGVQRVVGRTGRGLQFTGGDPAGRNQAGAVALEGMGEVDWSKGLTVELWLKLNALERSATVELVSNTVADRGPGFRFMISWQSLWLRSGEGGSGATWGAGSNAATAPLKIGEWTHLAGTYDGSIFRVYIDGALVKESDPGLKLTPGEKTIVLGSYGGGYAYGLDGVLDEVKLYNAVRSPAEIMLDARLGR